NGVARDQTQHTHYDLVQIDILTSAWLLARERADRVDRLVRTLCVAVDRVHDVDHLIDRRLALSQERARCVGAQQNRAQRLTHLMRNHSSHFAQDGEPLRMRQSLYRFFCSLAVGDIDGRSDVSEKHTVLRVAWHAHTVNPAEGTIVPTMSILDVEAFPPRERSFECFYHAPPILGVHTFRPAVAQLLLQGTTRECQPAVVGEFVATLAIHEPDHDRRGIGNVPEPLFALTQRTLDAVTLLDDDGHQIYGRRAQQEEVLQRQRGFGWRKPCERTVILERSLNDERGEQGSGAGGAKHAEAQRCPEQERNRRIEQRLLQRQVQVAGVRREVCGDQQADRQQPGLDHPWGIRQRAEIRTEDPVTDRRREHELRERVSHEPLIPGRPVALT